MGRACEERLPLFEDGTAPRVLITDWDRVEDIDAGLYCFVGTRPICREGIKFRQVSCYIDINYCGVSCGVGLALRHIRRLASGILIPALNLDDLRH